MLLSWYAILKEKGYVTRSARRGGGVTPHAHDP
jgi:hypothetical protein